MSALSDLATRLRAARGMAHKSDIADVFAALDLGAGAIPVGDDCAAIPDGDGFLLFAIEGFLNDFVQADPRFAGYCGIMVNLSDIAAMGGRPIAVVDALWSRDCAEAKPVLAGLKQAAETYGVPIVGGHTNTRNDRGQLAVAVLGRAKRLITSFEARPGDCLIAATDLRGAFRGESLNWDAASGAPAERLRGDLAILPELAEEGLVSAGKDISMAGMIGTAMMLLEASRCGATIDVDAIPCPTGIALERFLLAFPSFGFVLTARPEQAAAIIARFALRDIAAAVIGTIDASCKLRLWQDGKSVELWDFERPFIGCARNPAAREGADHA